MIKRYSNFEFLRIIAMLMIVIGHCVLYTAQNVGPYLGTLDNVGWLIKSFTIPSVNCYFILTGYFSKSENVIIGKILKLWLKTIIYSITVYIVFVAFGELDFNLRDIVIFIFPVMTKQYWFILTYIVLSFLSPFLCIIIDKTNMRQHSFLIVVCIIFFSLHETFAPVANTLDDTQGYGIICACILFIIGKWLAKYGDYYIFKTNSKVWLNLYLLTSIIIFLSNYFIMKFNIAGGIDSRGNFYAYNSITVLFSSICLFCFFASLKTKIRNNELINWLGGNCVAVYLITAHPLLIGYLWTDFFKMHNYANNIFLYLFYSTSFTLLLFLACIVIDKSIEAVMNRIGLIQMLKKIDEKLNNFLLFTNSN